VLAAPPQPTFNVLADPVGSYGPANAYLRASLLMLTSTASTFKLQYPLLRFYCSLFRRVRTRSHFVHRCYKRGQQSLAIGRRNLRSTVGHNHDPEVRLRRPLGNSVDLQSRS
jgi:hypothetical protein